MGMVLSLPMVAYGTFNMLTSREPAEPQAA